MTICPHCRNQSKSDDSLDLLLGIAGSIILLIGAFCPVVTLPIFGNISYIQGDGIIIAILAAISFILVMFRVWVGLYITSALSVGIMTYTFVNVLLIFKEVDSKLTGTIWTASVGWGFAVMAVGAGLIMASAVIQSRQRM